jgi:4'-phosphopantetheinyl transferase
VNQLSLWPDIPSITALTPPAALQPVLRLWGVHPSAADLAECERDLSSDELERARRFRVAGAQRQYVVGRSALRRILARFVGKPTTELHFEYTTTGKPLLAFPAASELQFNLSHSGDWILIAVAQNRRVGMDLELIQDRPELRQIARSFWAESEWAALERVSAQQWLQAFYRVWTRKEAVLKASGRGIAAGLGRPEVSAALNDRDLPACLHAGYDGTHWVIHDLAFDSRYAAALAVEAPEPDLDGARHD